MTKQQKIELANELLIIEREASPVTGSRLSVRGAATGTRGSVVNKAALKKAVLGYLAKNKRRGMTVDELVAALKSQPVKSRPRSGTAKVDRK